MKKLMIALAAVAMATAVNAAALNWTCTKVSAGNGIAFDATKAETKGNGYAVWCFLVSSTVASDAAYLTTYDTVNNALKGGQFASIIGKKVASGATGTTGGVLSGITSGSYGTGSSDDTVKAFLVVFDNADYTEAEYFSIATPKELTITAGAKSNKATGFSDMTSTYGWTKITPEPTSGLLMLLGMAGLALRRRRA